MLKTSVGHTCLFLCMSIIIIFVTIKHCEILSARNWSFRSYSIYSVFCRERSERPEEWVPVETASHEHDHRVDGGYSEILQVGKDRDRNVVDIFSVHSRKGAGTCQESLIMWLVTLGIIKWK